MIGDCDGDYGFEDRISKDNPFLIPYIETIEKFISHVKNVKNVDMVSFSVFDDLYDFLDKTTQNYEKHLYEIQFEQRSDGDLGWYSYKGYKISFFDENGDEFEVEIH